LGRLKIFLGIGPGVGKTTAMMQAAVSQQAAGRNVVVASTRLPEDLDADSHSEALPCIGPAHPHTDTPAACEINVAVVLERRPDIVVLDELASPNPPDARHARRYLDALTLLEAGIDVYSTLNVYEIASRAEVLWQITGLTTRDAVPDSILDNAEIALVDIAPSELLQRLQRGQFRPPKELAPSKSHFFEESSLLELREMATRLLAERAARDAQQSRQADKPARSTHRLLAAIKFGWEAEPLILLARRLAGSLNAPWIVLCVETGSGATKRAYRNSIRLLELARELGAEVITVKDHDFVSAVLRAATSRNITQIVTCKTEATWWQRLSGSEPTFAKLVRRSRDIDVHVASIARSKGEMAIGLGVGQGQQWQWFAAVAATAAVIFGGFLIRPLVQPTAASLLSLLSIVAVAAFLERGPALLATALIAVGWDYFFLPPYFHFSIDRPEDKVLVAMYFTVALILGQYTTRMRAAEAAERQREERATALYHLTRELAEASTTDGIVEKVLGEIGRLFNATAAVFLPDGAHRLQLHPASGLNPEENELVAATWVWERRQWAGKFTGNLPMINTMFLPLESSRRIVGVMGVRLDRSAPPTIHERNLLEALARHAAVALDRQHLRELSERAEAIAASERLGKTLLDSMSHEIRTPLSAIQAAAGNLEKPGLVNSAGLAALAEIQEGAERLNRLVGKVLDITRLESGHVKPLINECEVADIVNVAVAETGKQLAKHPFKVQMKSGLPIIRTDFVFLQQALMNLLANAATHTAPGTPVELRVWCEGSSIFLAVADQGPGIAPQDLPRVFDKFYRGPAAPTGGIGLGLSLVKGFVKAVGGDVTATNRADGGAEFTIIIPLSGPPR
jgi:two-component system sensor histidine kinase KdpD